MTGLSLSHRGELRYCLRWQLARFRIRISEIGYQTRIYFFYLTKLFVHRFLSFSTVFVNTFALENPVTP
jgi:hypothetical protein